LKVELDWHIQGL